MKAETLFRALLPLLCLCPAAWSQSVPVPPEPAVAAPSLAAAAPPPAISVPTDATEMMKLAAQINGLQGGNIKPWHLKASFQLYDDKGKPSEQGTMEEYWAAPHKYKLIYMSPSFTQTEWGTEDGKRYRIGAQSRRPRLLALVQSQLLAPLPTEAAMSKVSFTRYPVTLGGISYSCVSMRHEIEGLKNPPAGLFPAYCFDIATLALRVRLFPGGDQFIANEIVSFQNRYLPKAIHINSLNKPRLDVHMDSLTGLQSVIPPDFDRPANATIVQDDEPVAVKPTHLPENTKPPVPTYHVDPEYPNDLRKQKPQGIVTLEIWIEVNGSVGEIRILRAPHPELAEVAVATVKQWKFKPATENGKPIECIINVAVNFRVY